MGEPVSELDDDRLLQDASAGDTVAFRTLVDRHERFVYGMGLRLTGDVELSREIAQDVFVMIWKRASRYESKGSFRAYLASVTINVSRNARRKSARRSRFLFKGDSEPDSLPAPSVYRPELKDRGLLRSVLSELRPAYREILVLRYGFDFQVREIAEATGANEGTVKSHLARGLKQALQIVERRHARERALSHQGPHTRD
ncbi:MAG: sigma-70 family RNA polymerase sigma factor [Myxococcota bacterium]